MIRKLLLSSQMIWMIFIEHIEGYNPNKKRKILIVAATGPEPTTT